LRGKAAPWLRLLPRAPQIKESDLNDINHPAYIAPQLQNQPILPMQRPMAPGPAPAANPPKKQQVTHLVPHY
jgi:hypothetical protein